MSCIRGELWSRGVQTPKRMNFWRTKALKAKTFSIWFLPWNYSGISTDFDNPCWSVRLPLHFKECTHRYLYIYISHREGEERVRERERQQVPLPSSWCHCGDSEAAESGAPWCRSLILCSFSCRWRQMKICVCSCLQNSWRFIFPTEKCNTALINHCERNINDVVGREGREKKSR